MSALVQNHWKWLEKIALLSAIYFVIALVVPYSLSFYERLFSFSGSVPLQSLISYLPWFANNQAGKNFLPLLSVISLSVILGGITYWLYSPRINYSLAYTWFRIVVRYKLAAVMFWYGIQKAFPIQMPFPTLSQLNTKIGDVTSAKLYWLTMGASPSYQIFTGYVELLAVTLLLWRRTVTLGALLMVVIMVQVFALNVFYDAGVQLKSFAILVLSLFLVARERRTLYAFFIGSKPVQLDRSSDTLNLSRYWNRFRIVLKTLFILVFFVWRGYLTGAEYHRGETYKLPSGASLPGVEGYYDVAEFRLNGELKPYSPIDSTRWQSVVFERWNTLSIEVPRPVKLFTENRYRTTEFFSNVGREFYRYDIDTSERQLVVSRMGIPSEHLTFSYTAKDNLTIELAGITNQNDSLQVVLKRLPRNYLLIDKRGTFIPY